VKRYRRINRGPYYRFNKRRRRRGPSITPAIERGSVRYRRRENRMRIALANIIDWQLDE